MSALHLRLLAWGLLILAPTALCADGPADNVPTEVRRIPKLGIEVSDADRNELESRLGKISQQLSELRTGDNGIDPALVSDVEIFHRAVATNLTHQEFFSEKDVQAAKSLLDVAASRLEDLRNDSASWTGQPGLVVHGYRSELDDTVQPYGLVVPASYSSTGPQKYRLDIWFHGRGETLSETAFLQQRMRQVGQYTPEDTIVLHPYGRYSNAFKLAGEVDVLEALADVQRRYRIDDDRISVRGFSMGGAACWQFAVHYADRWFAANPGAGFSETPEFLKFFQKEELRPTWYERRLWHMYDCNDSAGNLWQCPTVAYSGELDIQKQAADIMEQALLDHRYPMQLTHIIGPETKHSIHPDSKVEIENRMNHLAERGRIHVPRSLVFETYSLKYNKMNWLTVNALEVHWRKASVVGLITPTLSPDPLILLNAENVTELELNFGPGEFPFDAPRAPMVRINLNMFDFEKLPLVRSDGSWSCRFHLTDEGWRLGPANAAEFVKKRDLQGPIDDAFMGRFLVVTPTGATDDGPVDTWIAGEQDRLLTHWRRQFRGDARVKSDAEVTDEDISDSHLILFGTPSNNAVLSKLVDQLPITWNAQSVQVGEESFDAAHHLPLLIFPNPLNPQRYVVLNSGFTYREYDYLNNARQVPKLPDWAVIDARVPATPNSPGKVVAADFFDEAWRLKPDWKLRNDQE